MFRLIPWSIGGNKVTAEEVKMLAVPQQKSPNMAGPTPHKLKRKRTNSSELGPPRGGNGVTSPTTKAESFHQANNVAQNNMSEAQHLEPTSRTPPSATSTDNAIVQTAASLQHSGGEGKSIQGQQLKQQGTEGALGAASIHRMDVETLRQTLEAQLSLEILLKHNELRLIDQEIAKCQVAMEQLRRCSEIPFPTSSISGISQAVSNGTGFAVSRPEDCRQPVSPSPWGVTDGPYSRHYARWLLPDPRFDGGELEPIPSGIYGAGKSLMEGRTTRGSWAESTSRSQRNSAGAKLQALSSGYPPPKDKAGPMIMKRKSDGKLVKLVCLDCRRDNFSSTQGFINHCRIAHNRSFASHDAAAAASGEPVEVDESGAMICRNNETASNAPPGYVHPLIRSAHVLDSTARNAMQKRSPSNTQREDKPVSRPVAKSEAANVESYSPAKAPPPSIRDSAMSPDFKASPQTPHLSALLQKQGLGLDLFNIVGDALTKTDIASYSSEDDSDADAMDVDTTSNVQEAPPNFRSTRLPARSVAAPLQTQRPSSRKGSDKRSQKVPSLPPLRHPPSAPAAHRSPYSPAMATRTSPRSERQPVPSSDIEMVDSNSPNLSPNTVESNQAPSLVSDDDEYEAPSESESPSPSPSESGQDDISFDNIEVQDGFEASGDGSTTSTTSVSYSEPHKRHLSTVTRPPQANPVKTRSIKRSRTSGTVENSSIQTEQKRVTFVSPPASPTKGKKGSARKPRRK
ncbi:hypothetical protein D8B26_006783 [Coccidioides posadasii str. Silveira]|uniref:Retrograde transporter n=1 Tax=Coccidioides posadasii (strain RMSCC 757 / Silveira) TaxID=443226 RepID=E9CRK9_COCPS|nr:retrograde transporter [Coccidioides posadasii str. Silveira]QVM12148.1 hypothetical protein D8B26_006783 [Coccidioides posadasii str. Silveira]